MSIKNIMEAMQEQGDSVVALINKDYHSKIEELKTSLNTIYEDAREKQFQIIKKNNDDYIQGQLLSYQLEIKKSILSAKQAFIHEVLDYVIHHFQDLLGQEQYYQLIKNLIQENVQEQDIVYLATQDMSFEKQLQKDIDISFFLKEGNLQAGVLIEKKEYNYNMSIQSLIEIQYHTIEHIIGSYL